MRVYKWNRKEGRILQHGDTFMHIKSVFRIFLFDDVIKQIKRDAKSVFEKVSRELSSSWEYFRDLNTSSRNETWETSF